MTDLASLAAPLLKATARARSLKDSTLVIKLGGSAMEDPVATAGTLDSIAALHQLGLKLVLVHGGGKPIDRAMTAAGLVSKKVMGRRHTDEDTLKIVVRVLCSEINVRLVEELKCRGVKAAGMTCVTGSRLELPGPEGDPVDLGFVGQPTALDGRSIQRQLKDGSVPVFPSLAKEKAGQWLNVNADTLAGFIAVELAAPVYYLTDTPGVLKNRHEPSSLLPRLTVAECKALIADGTIEGGMIPKVEACFEALEAGAKRAVILDGRNPHSLLSELVSDQILGTEILP